MPIRDITYSPVVAPIVTGSFPEGPSYSAWRPYGTRDYLLILTTEGSGQFAYVGGEIRTAPGSVTILRPGTPHDYGTARGALHWSLLWAHFLPRPHWMEWLTGLPEAAPGIAHLALGENAPAVEAALDQMNRYATGGLTRRTDFAMNALETALLLCDAANPQATARARFDERIARVMELLRGERLAESVSLEELAQEVDISASRLSHLFKEQTGQTPGQFQENERIVRARQLLALTSRSVAAIAEEVRFASPFYFTLRFKKRTGQSPREFRQKEHNQNTKEIPLPVVEP